MYVSVDSFQSCHPFDIYKLLLIFCVYTFTGSQVIYQSLILELALGYVYVYVYVYVCISMCAGSQVMY